MYYTTCGQSSCVYSFFSSEVALNLVLLNLDCTGQYNTNHRAPVKSKFSMRSRTTDLKKNLLIV